MVQGAELTGRQSVGNSTSLPTLEDLYLIKTLADPSSTSMKKHHTEVQKA